MIFAAWKLSPRYGRRYLLVYVMMCSIAGALSVVCCRALGSAIRLTAEGDNQFTHPMTYFFIIGIIICVLYQLVYLNRALEVFSTSTVSPVYYVCFTSVTIFAQFWLTQGAGMEIVMVVNQLLGFAIMCVGVSLLHGGGAESDGFSLVPVVDMDDEEDEEGKMMTQRDGKV